MLDIFLFFFVGAAAQLVDGALGMAYGICASSMLLALGVSPSASSAAVHTAEIATSGVSAFAHRRWGVVDKPLFGTLAIFGVLGAIAGASLLLYCSNRSVGIVVQFYLLTMGIRLFAKSFPAKDQGQGYVLEAPMWLLGVIGGFCDAFGGGGWGPIVTSSLLMRKKDPAAAVGTANAAEFVVTIAETLLLLPVVGSASWKAILGLVIGGVCVAPFGPLIVRRIPALLVLRIISLLVIVLAGSALVKRYC